MGVSLGNGASDEDETVYKPMAEINITPMVDVMLVLLIIFMVAAPLMMAGVPLELPKTTAARVSQTKKPMVVTLGPDGRVQIRDDFVEPDSLAPRLQALRAEEGDAVVYVRADKKSAYGDVMRLLGQVGQSGYGRVSLLSQSAQTATGGANPASVANGN